MNTTPWITIRIRFPCRLADYQYLYCPLSNHLPSAGNSDSEAARRYIDPAGIELDERVVRNLLHPGQDTVITAAKLITLLVSPRLFMVPRNWTCLPEMRRWRVGEVVEESVANPSETRVWKIRSKGNLQACMRPEILKTPVRRGYAETLQKCVILVLSEGVRFQRRKPLDRLTVFNAVRLRDGPVYDVGTAVYRQLEPTLAAPESQILSQ